LKIKRGTELLIGCKLLTLARFTLLTYLCFLPFSLSFAIDGADVTGEAKILSRLGKSVDLSLSLTDEFGKEFAIKDVMKPGRPLVILPVYYSCPRLCGLTLSGASKLINELPLKTNEDYSLLAVSFNPLETAADAHQRGEQYRKKAGGVKPKDWVFSVGKEHVVKALMDQVGFQYFKDGDKDFAHSAALIIVTPKGKVSQYFSDILYPVGDVRLALVEAAEERIGSFVDHLMLFCYRFDPLKGRYTIVAWNFARFGSLLFVGIFVSIVIYFVRKKA
jgi:protein SCO1